jgi:hypothetical protein
MTQSEQIFGKPVNHPLRLILLLAQLLCHLPGHRSSKRNQLVWSPGHWAGKGLLASASDRERVLHPTACLLSLRRAATSPLRLRSRWLALVDLSLALLQCHEDFRHKASHDEALSPSMPAKQQTLLQGRVATSQA